MKADLTLDFEALLTAAQVQWKLMDDKLTETSKAKYSWALSGRSMNHPEFRAIELEEYSAKQKYLDWVNENLTKRGIMYVTQHANGKPKTLFVIVAGTDSHILSAT